MRTRSNPSVGSAMGAAGQEVNPAWLAFFSEVRRLSILAESRRLQRTGAEQIAEMGEGSGTR